MERLERKNPGIVLSCEEYPKAFCFYRLCKSIRMPPQVFRVPVRCRGLFYP